MPGHRVVLLGSCEGAGPQQYFLPWACVEAVEMCSRHRRLQVLPGSEARSAQTLIRGAWVPTAGPMPSEKGLRLALQLQAAQVS